MKLYQFQEDFLFGMPAKAIFACDTGTGKTVMALEHYRRHAFPMRLLILGPAAKMRTGDWQKHVEEMFGEYGPQVKYYSYEKFSRNPTPAEYRKTGNRGVWREYAESNISFAVICDEVHRAAVPTSGIGKAVYEISKKAQFFVGLSATPAPNGWISVANYFKIFGFTKNVTEFKKKYCNIQTFKGFPEIVGYYYEDEIKSLWNKISKPLKKENAIDLPSLTEIPVNLEAGKLYAKTRKERAFNGEMLDNPSAFMHALRQSTMENKLPWLDEFLEGTSSNVVIFYNYVSEREAILSLIKKNHKKRQVFRMDGERHDDISKGYGSERSITLAQYQSGSTGVEMQYADTIVFFSPTYSYSTYHQAIGRIERIGQKNAMSLYKVSCPSTIESDVWEALKNKTDFQERIWANEHFNK